MDEVCFLSTRLRGWVMCASLIAQARHEPSLASARDVAAVAVAVAVAVAAVGARTGVVVHLLRRVPGAQNIEAEDRVMAVDGGARAAETQARPVAHDGARAEGARQVLLRQRRAPSLIATNQPTNSNHNSSSHNAKRNRS
mgnify:CR=1 FL=1